MSAAAKSIAQPEAEANSISVDDIIEQLKSAIEPTRNGKKRTPRVGRQALRALKTESWPLSARWIHSWFMALLKVRKRKLSTVKRYSYEVMDDILVGGIGIDFEAFDAVDFGNFYQRALNESHKRKDLAYKAGRFDDLHTFGVNTFDFARLPEPLNQQSNDSRVRAIIIPESVFVHGRNRVLDLSEYDEAGRQCLWVLLTVLHRAGLRRSDALTLRITDMDPGDTFWIRITDNAYADTKRSKTRIPLTPLLLPEERQRVHDFLYDRLRSGDSGDSLVFHPSGAPKQPWNEYEFGRVYAQLIRCDETGKAHTPHDSRHTCVSHLQLVLSGHSSWISALTPYSEIQSEQIRTALFSSTESGKNDYWSLAAFAAHSSPKTTFNSYLHYTHLLLFEAVRHVRAPLSFNQIRNLGGVTARVVNRWCDSENVDQASIPVDSLDAALSLDLAKHTVCIDRARSIEPERDELPDLYRPFHRSAQDIEVAYPALHRHFAKGTTIDILVRTLGYSTDVVASWIDNCELIGSLRTRKHNGDTRRHVAMSRAKNGAVPLLPPKPRHRSEVALLSGSYAAIEQALLSARDDLQEICAYWLTHSTVSNSGLPLENPRQLEHVLSLFATVLPAPMWRLRILTPAGENPKDVQRKWIVPAGLNVEIRNAQTSRRSTSVWLYLRHPDEKDLITMTRIAIRRDGESARLPKKFSSQLLRYLLHMTSIVAFETTELQEMVKS